MHVVRIIGRFVVVVAVLAGTSGIWAWGDLSGLRYFTNLSALYLGLVMVWALIAEGRGRSGPPAGIKAAATMFELVTATVSFIALRGEGSNSFAFGLTYDQLMHQLVPLAAVLDFVLLDVHRRLHRRHAMRWIAAMLGYLVLTLVVGVGFDGGYPYPFLDANTLGWGQAAVNIAVVLVGSIALATIVVLVDRKLPARPVLGAATLPPDPAAGAPRAGAAQESRVP